MIYYGRSEYNGLRWKQSLLEWPLENSVSMRATVTVGARVRVRARATVTVTVALTVAVTVIDSVIMVTLIFFWGS